MFECLGNFSPFGALIARSILCANIEDLVSLWDLIASGSIYSQKKHIEESFTIVVKANDYVKQFLRYQQFSVW